MKNIYLDIDGTILLDDLENAGQYALNLSLFLFSLHYNRNKVFWLTTHCRDGSDKKVLEYLKSKLEPHDYDFIVEMNVQPTTWKELKTEAIDFSEDFLWFDDDATLKEREVLKTHKAEHKLIEMDLQKDKYQLRTISYSGILGDKFPPKSLENGNVCVI